MAYTIFFIGLLPFAYASVYSYTGGEDFLQLFGIVSEVPRTVLKFENQELNCELTSDIASAFVISPESKADQCNADKHKAHVPKGQPVRKNYEEKFRGYQAAGSVYTEKVEFLDHKFDTFNYGVVDKTSGKCLIEMDCRIGLNLAASAAVKDAEVFSRLLEKESLKQIIFARGTFEHTYEDGYEAQPEEMGGKVGFGESKMSDCDAPAVYHEVSQAKFGGRWAIIADVTIKHPKGIETLKKQTVGFSLNEITCVPDAVSDKHFEPSSRGRKRLKKNPFPDFVFSADGQDYSLLMEDYTTYIATDAYGVILKDAAKEYDFLLGREFLQNYCLFLKVENEKQLLGLSRRRIPPHPSPSPTSTIATTTVSETSRTTFVKTLLWLPILIAFLLSR